MTKLVQELQAELTHVEAKERMRGTEALVSGIRRVQREEWDAKQAQTLLQFFQERMDDWSAVRPVLRGCEAVLQKAEDTQVALDKDSVQSTILNLFRKAQVPVLSQESRNAALKLLMRLLKKPYRKDVAQLGNELVEGVIANVDGERDPRNLILVFQVLVELYQTRSDDPEVLINALQEGSEDAMDLLACYFPLTFTPPPNDPHGVTRDQLAVQLCRAMTCSVHLVPHCVPLVLEKLKSSHTQAKVDALDTISQLATNLPLDAMLDEIMVVWRAVRSEIVPSDDSPDPEFQEQATRAMGKCLRAWWSAPTPMGGNLATLVVTDKVLEEALDHIRQTVEKGSTDMRGEKITRAAQSLCTALASSSTWCTDLVAEKLLQKILPYAVDKMPQITQEYALGFASSIAASAKKVLLEASQTPGLTLQAPLATFKDDLLSCFIAHMNGKGRPKDLATAGAVSMVTFPAAYDIVPRPQCRSILEQLMKDCVVLEEEEIARGHSLPVVGLLEAGKSGKTELVKDFIIPQLAASFKEDDGKTLRSKSILSLLMRLCSEVPDLELLCMETLQDIFDHSLEEIKTAPNKLSGVLEILSTRVLPKSGMVGRSCAGLAASIIPKLLAEGIAYTSEILEEAEKCVACSMTLCSPQLQAEFADLAITSMLAKDLSSFSVQSAALCAVDSSVELPQINELVEILTERIVLAGSTENARAEVESAVVLLASIINKAAAALVDTILASSAWDKVKFALEQKDPANMVECVMALVWVTKALAMRKHPLTSIYTQHIIDTLKAGLAQIRDEAGRSDAVAGYRWLRLCTASFGIILRDFEFALSKDLGAVTNVLYKQAFFMSTLPISLDLLGSAPPDGLDRAAFVSVVSNLAIFSPPSLVMDWLDSVLPIIIDSLVCLAAGPLRSNELVLANEVFLSNLLMEAAYAEKMRAHLKKLVEALTFLIENHSSGKVRETAVDCCVVMLDNVGYEHLYPYHKVVTQVLHEAFGDKQQTVRKAAVKGHRVWTATFAT